MSADAKDNLIDAFVWAIRNRPQDLRPEKYKLVDTKSGLVWWTANEDYGFHLYEPHDIRFGYWQRRRAWKAVRVLLQWHENGTVNELLAKLIAANEAAIAKASAKPCRAIFLATQSPRGPQ